MRSLAPRGDPWGNRFVATAAPITHTGRPASASPGERKRPSDNVTPLVSWKASVVPITRTCIDSRFL